jgi:hypothetical protein
MPWVHAHSTYIIAAGDAHVGGWGGSHCWHGQPSVRLVRLTDIVRIGHVTLAPLSKRGIVAVETERFAFYFYSDRQAPALREWVEVRACA